MTNEECVEFMQWALPHMQLYWPGFRKVRSQVCKRIRRRWETLGLADSRAYRDYLQCHAAEWDVLQGLCHVSISRFYRDRTVFEALERVIMPALAAVAAARPDRTLACWSAGCASGEEAYTLSMLWQLRLAERHPNVALQVLATDVDRDVLKRAALACYPWSSIRELPEDWRAEAFEPGEAGYRLRDRFRATVEFMRQDVCETLPGRTFDLVLCRNLALTYFEPGLRADVMHGIVATLRPGAALVTGLHESLPPGMAHALRPWPGTHAIFRKLEAENGDHG